MSRIVLQPRATIPMVFGPALEEMAEQDARTYGPVSFRDYVADRGIESAGSTPRHISINAREDLEGLDMDGTHLRR